MSTGVTTTKPTSRVAPERTATPNPPRRAWRPNHRWPQAVTGTAAGVVAFAVIAAPVAALAVGGVALALGVLLVGVPALSARGGRAADTVGLAAVGAASVGLGLALGGWIWATGASPSAEQIALVAPWLLGGCAASWVVGMCGAATAARLHRSA